MRPKIALLAVAVLLAGTALGLVSNTLSPIVSQDIPVIEPNITLTVTGVPSEASAGDVFPVVATLKNNANRPSPAVLRFEVRNPDGIAFDEITVYAECGAEARVSSKTLSYYIGWHGPLLAPNGTHFPSGTSLVAVETTLGPLGHWSVVLHEIQERDPNGYAELIDPGLNASLGPRISSSEALKALYYYGMVSAADEGNPNPSAWRLTMPFSDTIVATGGGFLHGFLVEISLIAKGSYEFEFWAERPDVYGVPNHAWKCEPL
ncbi:MAG: hypothetical protein ACE5JE_09480 [Thermoplasmata archaeon]